MNLGNFECYEVVEGYFRLDGGAMFGSVPKALWEKVAPADEQNRIHMALRALLILQDKRAILVDTGIGRKFPAKFEKMYGIDHSQTDIHHALAKHTLTVGDITDVILTHFHFDHAGGVSYRDEKGALQLTFPNAQYWVHRDNVKLCRQPNPKDRASYLEENIQPVLESGKVTILEDGREFLPGISGFISYGHTTGLLCPRVESMGKSILYCADLIPMVAHIPLAYIMGYDLYASTTMQEKQYVMDQAIADHTALFFVHDPVIAACHVQIDDKGRYSAGAVIDMGPRDE